MRKSTYLRGEPICKYLNCSQSDFESELKPIVSGLRQFVKWVLQSFVSILSTQHKGFGCSQVDDTRCIRVFIFDCMQIDDTGGSIIFTFMLRPETAYKAFKHPAHKLS